jgi:hypothetical protein
MLPPLGALFKASAAVGAGLVVGQAAAGAAGVVAAAVLASVAMLLSGRR